jgi:ech hydrogenase subunit D
MRIEPQNMTTIESASLTASAGEYKEKGYRFVQCLAHSVDSGFELTYSFDKDLVLENVRVVIAAGTVVESISSIFPAAFIFENEMHDLYGIDITGISVDFKGRFYQLRENAPMAPEASETADVSATE